MALGILALVLLALLQSGTEAAPTITIKQEVSIPLDDTVLTVPLVEGGNGTREIDLVVRSLVTELREQRNNTSKLHEVMEAFVNEMKVQTLHLEDIKPGWPTGRSEDYAARSCQEILKDDASSSSGYYWIQSYSSPPVQVYCDMTRELRGNTGPWMRVAYVDMKDPTQSCPSGFRTVVTEGETFCARTSPGNTCASTYFTVHGVNYTKVCGRALGYQKGSPDAFGPYHDNPSRTIDDVYVEGLSITHGYGPRNHIWTFAAALHEVITRYPQYICPCTNIDNHANIRVPHFIEEDYYCDTGAPADFALQSFYRNDPLWDGKGCGLRDTCCARQGNQPWFCKTLDEPTTDTIEVRVCAWRSFADADPNFQQLELYVQ